MTKYPRTCHVSGGLFEILGHCSPKLVSIVAAQSQFVPSEETALTVPRWVSPQMFSRDTRLQAVSPLTGA